MVLVLLVAAPVGVASAAPAGTVTAASVLAEQPQPPNPTAPPGVNIDTEQQSENAKSKLVVGIVAVVLLGIVVVGRNSHNKRRKAAQG